MSTDLPIDRRLAFLCCVVVLLVAVALQSIGDTTSSAGDASVPAPSASPSAPSIGIDTFCASYTALAQTYGVAMSAIDDSTAVDQLELAGEEFRTVGVPPGMGSMEVAGRDLFVADALSSVGGQAAEVEESELANEQLTAFSRYLSTACPGY